MHYLIKSKELIYRKNTRAKPYFIYILLSVMNKIPFHHLPKFFPIFLNRFFRVLRLKATFIILNKKLRFYLHSGMYDFTYHGGMPHEPRISEVFLHLVPSNSVFYDIGSSIGWYSVLLADKCKKIIAFDPFDKSSLINVSLNKIDNFEFYNYFLSDHKSSGKFETSTIDNLIKEKSFTPPDVIKIDVEGEEDRVLLGSKELFRKNPPKIVLIETHSEKLFYKCIEFLKQFNYEIRHLGCPKVNVGGDIYPLSYNLNTAAYSTKSATRIIMAIKKQ